MRAVIAQDNQPTIVDIPTPKPANNEILVKVSATALNRADLMQVTGNYPPPEGAPDTLGLELVGEVVAIGGTESTFPVGARVMALVGGGGYADYALVPEEHALLVPDNLSDVQAAGVMEAFLTAYSNMFDLGRLQADETVLIHAGASGVGLAATQMAKAVGAYTSSSPPARPNTTFAANTARICASTTKTRTSPSASKPTTPPASIWC